MINTDFLIFSKRWRVMTTLAHAAVTAAHRRQSRAVRQLHAAGRAAVGTCNFWLNYYQHVYEDLVIYIFKKTYDSNTF